MKNALLVLVLAVALCTTSAWSQGGPRPGGPPPMAPCPVMAILPPPAGAIDGITQALGLTTDQATALKAILISSGADIQPKMQTLGEKTKALRDAVLVAAPDQAAVEAAIANVQAAETAVITAGVYWWNQITVSGILTADQLAGLMAGPGPGPGGPPPAPPSDGSSTSSTGTAGLHRHR